MKLPGWPALVLHELTHAAAAVPFADVSVDLASAHPHAELQWREGTPRAAIRAAHLAPTMLGVVVAALTALTAGAALSGSLPSNPFHALAVGLLVAYNWLLYVWPSASDRRPFAAGIGGGDS